MKRFTLMCMLAAASVLHAQSFQWIKQFNGDFTKDLERDGAGNIYFVGDYRDAFACGSAYYTTGTNQSVIVKYDEGGNCQWLKELPALHAETFMDEGDNLYVTGTFTGTITFGSSPLASRGDEDVYLAKFNTSGALLWVKHLGGPGKDAVVDVSARNGSVYVTGSFGPSITVDGNTFTESFASAEHNFYLARFTAAGNFSWLQQAVSRASTSAWDLGSDNLGNAYVFIAFDDTAHYGTVQMDFDRSPYSNMGLIKYNVAGTAMWGKHCGNQFRIVAHDLTVDPTGNIYRVWGITYSELNIRKMDPDGNTLWTTSGGGAYSTSCGDIKVNSAGEVFMTGSLWPGASFGTMNFPSVNGEGRQYTAKISASGEFKWVLTAPGSSENAGGNAEAIAVSAEGKIFIAGSLTGDPTYFGQKEVSMTNGNVFISRISEQDFIHANNTWKYLDNGSNQGTAWRQSSFNDSSWPRGNAELGYGDGDEATVVLYGGNPNFKHITTYFRSTFYAGDLTSFSGLELSLLRDDGAVVYINGVEVFRSNMPSGTITYTTEAPGYGNLPEGQYDVTTIGKDMLVDGFNVIAVEVHQESRTSSDISFNLKLKKTNTVPVTDLVAANSGWKYRDWGNDPGPTWKNAGYNDAGWAQGNAELGYGDGGENTVVSYGGNPNNKFITTYFRKNFNVADTSSFSGLELSLIRDDGAVVYINGTEVYRNNMPNGTILYNTLASSSAEGSSWIVVNIPKTSLQNGSNLIAVEIHQRSANSSDISFNLKLKKTNNTPDVEFITAGSSWKYLDNGTNQGTTWRSASFNDGSWASGNAELGYGDGGESTVVSYGSSAGNKHITTYFRKSFNVTNASSFTALELGLVRDDGAVVYLNGVEVYRTNMPSGTIFYNTLAPSYIDGGNESAWIITNISSSALVNGTNLIAVEIHQNWPSSSDISFNLKLKGLTNARIGSPEPLVVEDTLYTITGKGDFMAYPNPNNGNFTFEFCLTGIQDRTLDIEIMNTMGQVVYKKQPEIINNCVKEIIELQKGLPAGVYILTVMTDTRKESKQIVLAY